MKGVVFNLFEDIVRTEYGEDGWGAALREAGAGGAYTSLGNYPDAEFLGLVAAVSARAGDTPAGVVRWFGRRALPLLADRYPEFFTGHTSTRSFLLTLNDIIHPEVRKIYADADVPEFDYDTSDPAAVVMGYRSRRALCAFGQGLVEGAADYYRQAIGFEHLACVHRGDAACRFRISFPAGDAP